LSAIAISHPHYYAAMGRWSLAFDAPIYLHEDDRAHVVNHGGELVFWTGETREIGPGLTLIRCGGHFAGGTVAHWDKGGNGKGALFTGDIVMVIPDRSHVSFMRSYPNLIPLSGPSVERLGRMLEPFDYDVIYGAFFDRNVTKGAKLALQRSVKRYHAAVTGDGSRELQ
jgi:hypothetical protein